MNNRKLTVTKRFVALVLAMVLLVPAGTEAATVETAQPYASKYLQSYGAYIYPAADGKIQVWFNVIGVEDLDSLGALSIHIYHSGDNVNWSWYKTFNHSDNPKMLDYNDNYHSGYVECQGTPGRYYKAYVCIWGGRDGSGDTRYFYTSSKKAVVTPTS